MGGGGGYKVRFYSGWQLVGIGLCTVVNYSQLGYSLSGGLLGPCWVRNSQMGYPQSGGLLTVRWAACSQLGGLPTVRWAAHSDQVGCLQLLSTHRWATHSQVGYSQLGGLLAVRLSRHNLMGSGYLLTVR